MSPVPDCLGLKLIRTTSRTSSSVGGTVGAVSLRLLSLTSAGVERSLWRARS